jgi:Carboxypeptidase regulatory-like domain
MLLAAVLAALSNVCLPATGACTPATRVFTVAPAEPARTFVWRDETELVFGTIPPRAARVDVDAIGGRRVFLTIVAHEVPVTLAAGQWTWTLADASSLRVVRVPREASSLVVSAPRHRPARFDLATDRLALGRITLQRYETLEGRVVEGTSAVPVAGARITNAAGEELAVTDASGTFEIDIDARMAEAWPAALHVSAAGYGKKMLPLAEAPRPRQWNRVELSRGGGIRVRVQHDDAEERGEVVLELRRKNGKGWETVARGVTTLGAEPVAFDELDPGAYVLTCTGRAPLAQLARDVEIRAGDLSEAVVRIEPVPLRIEVSHRGQPVAANLRVHFGGRWDAQLTAAGGVFEGELWQPGALAASVSVGERGSFMAHKSIEGEAEWRIEVPDRTIRGRVIDRATGAPLAGVAVDLIHDGGGKTVETDAGGAYAFDFLEPGRFMVTATAPGRLAAEAEILLGEHDRMKLADLRLAASVQTRIRFVAPDGRPAAKTKVHDVARDRFGETDDSGEIVLELAKDETRRLFAVPWRGAFAIVDVTAQTDRSEPLLVRFEDGPSTLTISAKDDSGKPISALRYRLRYNGQDLPEDVLAWLAARDGNRWQTSSDGVSILAGLPVGVYELWPVTSPRATTTHGAAPVRVAVQAGDNPVKLTFTRW